MIVRVVKKLIISIMMIPALLLYCNKYTRALNKNGNVLEDTLRDTNRTYQ